MKTAREALVAALKTTRLEEFGDCEFVADEMVMPFLDAAGYVIVPKEGAALEQVEAGFAVLQQSGIADEYLKNDKHTVAEIYEAMLAARPK